MSSTSRDSLDLFSYLETLPKASLLSIYEETRGDFASKTVLQKLPELARQFVIRLSVCGGSFPFSQIISWTSSRNKRDVRIALMKMQSLGVIDSVRRQERSEEDYNSKEIPRNFVDANDIDPDCQIKLTSQFYIAIRKSLTSLSPSPYNAITAAEYEQMRRNEGKSQAKYPNEIPSATELETYTQTRWDAVLHFLVGTNDKDIEDPPGKIMTFVEETGLMQKDPKGQDLIITSKGYEFMLQEVCVQVWQFILKYIEHLKTQKNHEELRKEALLFLICLSYCKVGRGYRAMELSKPMRGIMKEFALFGLLYLCKIGGSLLFFPTRAAVNLVVGGLVDFTSIGMSDNTSLSALSSSAAATRALEVELAAAVPSKNHIALIVQTNFQVAAYTTSSLHLAMLGLFCDVTTFRRLPNIIFYRITRDSVKYAFKLGIEAKQILRWMKMHAHPRLRTGDQSLIPANVEDQIILWDRERTRVKMEEVYEVQCNGHQEWNAVTQFAIDNEAYSWGNEEKCKLLVSYKKAELVVAERRRWRARNATRQEEIDSGR